MTSVNDFTIGEGEVPDDGTPDETPPFIPVTNDPDSLDNPDNWFDAQYPHSTKDHPYGYFPDKDGNPDYDKPRKRKPHSRRSSGSGVQGRMPATDKQARTAAALLARMNLFLGMGLGALGLPITGMELARANVEFEEMAYQALLNDPELCRKIMAAGTTSGRTQLTLAYVMLGGSLAPLAWKEVKDKRASDVVDQEGRNVA